MVSEEDVSDVSPSKAKNADTIDEAIFHRRFHVFQKNITRGPEPSVDRVRSCFYICRSMCRCSPRFLNKPTVASYCVVTYFSVYIHGTRTRSGV